MSFTKKKFLSLSPALQHKHASVFLQSLFSGNKEAIISYREVEAFLRLPLLDLLSQEEVSERFHFHLEKAGLSKKEHNLLHIRTKDTTSNAPFLPIDIFLSSLRSAFNVGSIFRTVEAFRLGTIHLGGSTPNTENPKVQKAAMGSIEFVPSVLHSDLQLLPRPWIALETASPSTPLYSTSFPPKFTLIVGNEEFGISKEILSQCDKIVEIPLQGSKNSLNVAAAFAIAASYIRHLYQG
jgi:tRNA G18 (ribose-2'-O)-methylase SpoU